MTTHHFILTQKPGDKEPLLYWVKDMPEDSCLCNPMCKYPFTGGLCKQRNSKEELLKVAIDSSIRVFNQEELGQNLIHGNSGDLAVGEIYSLECIVEIKVDRVKCKCYFGDRLDIAGGHTDECRTYWKVFVKLKEEAKEENQINLINQLLDSYGNMGKQNVGVSYQEKILRLSKQFKITRK